MGGVLVNGELGPLSVSVDASRRALQASLLSWAGVHDPATGQVWGGVLANGLRVGMSKDEGGAFGAWSSLGLHRLSGKNVAGNTRKQVMGGAYWRVMNDTDRQLSLGVTGMHWNFSQNVGEYSFGHGGYYSPERYRSLSLPLSYGQRGVLWSFTVRAALSRSWSQGAAGLQFPADPQLQDLVGTLGYSASAPGRSVGRSLATSVEYQMSPQLFVGGKFDFVRSVDYSPTRATLYLRYALGRGAAKPVAFPPEAPNLTSRY